MKKTVVLGVTSGIAAYKTLELVKQLCKENIEVHVIMTDKATKMVSPSLFEKITQNKVLINLFEKGFDYKKILNTRKVDHITIADSADCFVIAPLTANTLGKIAHGMADDFLTTTLLAVRCPVILCPSMNVNMWNNSLVNKNILKLKQLGYHIIEPENGALACGYEGKGRLADIKKIKSSILTSLASSTELKGKKILITTGGTIEKIDDIRYISNFSSGKMGIALAEDCLRRGADVLLLRAKNAVIPSTAISEELFTSSDNLLALLQKHIKNFDILFHAAAVSDFLIEKPFTGKLKSNTSINIVLKPRVKILDLIKRMNPRICLIAFKAEHKVSEDSLIQLSFTRLQQTNSDAIIANDVGKDNRGFEVDTNEVFIILKNNKTKKIPLAEKKDVAKSIIDYLLKHLSSFS